jgi:hypothetical protein
MGSRRILTAIALFAGFSLIPLDDLITVAIRAENRNENHSFSPPGEKISIAYLTKKVQI